jgi:putative ABC transport system permease protein
MILRKMAKNKWLELSLLLGLILSVALVSSMPIYTEAILQRMLVKDLENLQKNTGQYPTIHWSNIYLGGDESAEDKQRAMQNTDKFLQQMADGGFGLPMRTYVRERATDIMRWAPVDTQRYDASVNRPASVGAMADLQDNIRLIDGRMPAKEPVNGVYEALVVESALTNLKMVLDTEFVVTDKVMIGGKEELRPIHIKPVGVFEKKSDQDLYFYNTVSSYNAEFLIDFDLFERDFTTSKALPVRAGYWYITMDYSDITLRDVNQFLTTSSRIESYLGSTAINYGVKVPAIDTFGKYFEREKTLRKMLWSLNVPVMIMLGFYLFMVSNLITERQKTEIAVLRSRGASRLQVLFGYVIEGLLLGAVAYIVGPYVGLMLTKVLGASNGFLEFVQRSALRAEVGASAYKYALYAVLGSVVMTLIPAFIATRTSIVSHKQQMARQLRMSFWHRFFIDVMLVGISIYGLIRFEKQQKDFISLGVDSSSLSVDPLLFLVPALFILGGGLLILRIYPWFVRLVYWVGRKWWPPSLYSTLIQVGRSSTQYQFLMVFLSMTIATGLYSASAARTLNKNVSDKIMYQNGTDMILGIRWDNDAPPPDMGGAEGAEAEMAAAPVVKKRVQYTEPPFQPFAQLPGVESAARVFTKDNAVFAVDKDRGTATLMGIDTDDFGRTAWLRDRLLDHHFYEYLNLLSTNPKAVLISRTLAEQKNVKVGDTISVGWNGVEARQFLVYGIVDYWPTFNPNPTTKPAANSKSKPVAPMLIVGHLSYIQNSLALEPYNVWIKFKSDALLQPFYDALAEKGIPVENIVDTRQSLRDAKNDPFQLAINGVMTLGFIISIMISFFGFLLYWVLSLNGRILQLGILRAMGISFLQLVGMLVTEQVLTSGAAIGIGVLIGNVTSELFVKLFQVSFDPTTQIPPFQVVFDPNDSLQLYMIVTIMIAIGLLILSWLLSRIKIHQAVKLGED